MNQFPRLRYVLGGLFTLMVVLSLGAIPGVESGGYIYIPKLRLTDTTSGGNVLLVPQGARITLDGLTGAKYLSSDGTTLSLTGLNYTVPVLQATGDVSTVGTTALTVKLGQLSGAPGIWFATATPSFSNFSFLFDGANSILNTTAGGRVDLRVNNATYFSSTSTGNCSSSGTAASCDGALATGPLTVGLSGTAISKSVAGSATLDFGSSVTGACTDLTVAVTGAVAGAPVDLGIPNAAMVTGSTFVGWVSATNTVSIRHCCVGSVTCDPASSSFAARVFIP